MKLSELISKQQKLEQEILAAQQFLSSAPSGRLIVRNSKSGFYRYSISEKDKNNHRTERYLNKDNSDLISLLANKIYLESRLIDLKKEKNFTDAQIAYLTSESKVESMLKHYPGIHEFLNIKETDFARDAAAWQNQPYKRSYRYPDDINNSTIVKDLFVRSKAEADIVSLLVANGVPFHYDEIITIDKIDYAMDFVCLNVRTGQIWYWDHQGMLDNLNYIKKTLNNQNAFLQAGFIPWINTIVTTETKNSPLDLQWVDTIIKYYLV